MNKFYFGCVLFFLTSCSVERKNDSESSSSPALKSGKEIYSERCTSCHGQDGKLGFGGAKDLTLSKKSKDEVIHQVSQGKGAMAPFKNILSEEEILAVSEYAISLRHH